MIGCVAVPSFYRSAAHPFNTENSRKLSSASGKEPKNEKKEVHEDLGSASSTDRPILSVPAVYGLVALLPTRREKD